MKVLAYGILIAALICTACQSATPVREPDYTKSPTNTMTPTSISFSSSEAQQGTTTPTVPSILPTVPAFLEFYYDEQTCGIDLPDRFTSMRCYSINTDWFTLGLLAYFGSNIDFISVSHAADAPQFVVEQSTKFVTDVALFAGWNMNDLAIAMEGMIDSANQEWIPYNTIEATRYITLETNVVVVGFERIP